MNKYNLIAILFIFALIVACKSETKKKKFDFSNFNGDYKTLLTEEVIDTLTYTRGILLKKERILDELEGKIMKR